MAQHTSASPAVRAAQSAGRAGGYCWMQHPSGHAHCTRPPHDDDQHIDHYTDRPSPTATSGIEWEA